jgi:hypothetical protein
MSWGWAHNFASCLAMGTCQSQQAVDGQIPYTSSEYSLMFLGNMTMGGMLEWTVQPGRLREVLMPLARSHVDIEAQSNHFTEGWATVDAQTTPLAFHMAPQAGDPPTALVYISPRLDGRVALGPGWYLGSSIFSLQYFVTVELNGEQVARDSLVADLTGPPLMGFQTVQFPNGLENDVARFIEGSASITIHAWAKAVAHSVGGGTTTWGESSCCGYSAGPALVVDITATGVTGVEDGKSPAGIHLSSRPNPFQGASRILYELPAAGPASVAIYDVKGSRVATLLDRVESAGRHEVAWDGRDSRGVPVAAGIYIVKLSTGSQHAKVKLIALGK